MTVLDAEIAVALRAVDAPPETNPDVILSRLEALLRARYPGATVVLRRHPRRAAPARVEGGPAPERVSADIEVCFCSLLQRAAREVAAAVASSPPCPQ
jgi:hypothetical protein